MIDVTILADDYAGYECNLLGQHGFSALIEVLRRDRKFRILFDTGQHGKALLYNMKKLGLNINDIDYIVLSHRHYDHTGGLLDILKKMKNSIHVIAHPDLFKPNIVKKPYLRDVGLPYRREELEKEGAIFLLSREPIEIVDGLFFIGEVSRVTTFEKPIETYTIDDNGKLILDMLLDDTSLAIKADNENVIIVTGCSHSGIVNITNHVQKLVGAKKVKAIIGGLHLISAKREIIIKTAEELKRLNVEEVHAGHCTGFNALCILQQVFGDNFKVIHSGYKLRF